MSKLTKIRKIEQRQDENNAVADKLLIQGNARLFVNNFTKMWLKPSHENFFKRQSGNLKNNMKLVHSYSPASVAPPRSQTFPYWEWVKNELKVVKMFKECNFNGHAKTRSGLWTSLV